MPKDNRLGKGLSAIFGDIDSLDDETAIQYLPIDSISPNPNQPRQDIKNSELKNLAESIKEKGIIQPIIVRQKNGIFEIVAGERRLEAAKIAGLENIPAIEKNFTDEESAEIALIENIQRKNLNPIEEAYAYKNLMDKFNYTQEELSKKIGKDRATISNTLRLLKLPDSIIKMLQNNEITAGHARSVLSVKDKNAQKILAEKIKKKNLSVRDAEKIVYQKQQEDYYKNYESDFFAVFKRKVQIKYTGKKGKIEMEFKDKKDLDDILNRAQK